MLSHKEATLFGANAIFLSVAGLLFLFPGQAALFFPAFALILCWNDFRADAETHGIFLFLATIAALLVASRAAPPEKWVLAAELALVWAVGWALSSGRGRLEKERRRVHGLIQECALEIRDLERDLRFYSQFQDSAGQQIRARRELTDAAKSLSSPLDAREVQLRLIGILQAKYPSARVQILPGQPQDPLVEASVAGHGSMLVRDAQSDERFRARPGLGFRSAIVAPMTVMRQPFGFLKLESDAASTFAPEDLKSVDFFATLASLALENIHFYESIHTLATHDALTQLYTHKAFQNRLEEEVLRAGRGHTPVSMILCDVDHFKRYNDSYGHQAGDVLLQKVATILASHARPVDFAARYGGEEFALILPSVGREQAVELAERIRSRIASEPFLFQSQPTRVSASFGVSCFPNDATTPSQLLRAADERLYRAKAGGRNRVIG